MYFAKFNLKGFKQPITRLGLGGAAIGGHGWGKRNDNAALKTISACLENGISLFDTADVYGFGNSESLFGKAFRAFKIQNDQICLATKGGVAWNSSGKTYLDSSPNYLRQALENSLKRLQMESIPLYFLHWQDSQTPLEKSLNFLAKMREQGKIGALGVCNISVAKLEKLKKLKGYNISAIQLRSNMLEPFSVISYFDLAKELNASLINFSSLADGLLAGKISKNTRFLSSDHRNRYPLFQKKMQSLTFYKLKILKEISKRICATPGQFSLRWLLEFNVLDSVLFGAKTPNQAKELMKAESIKFSHKDLLSGCRVALNT